MKKTLFIYYSHSQNGDLIATKLKLFNIENRKVIPLKPLPKSFFFSMMVGGFEASINKKPRLFEFDSIIEEYDSIIIGSPIWNDRLASPINSVLDQLDFSGKKFAFILYSGSGNGNHAIKKLNKLYNQPKILILKEPKKYTEELNKLQEFVETL